MSEGVTTNAKENGSNIPHELLKPDNTIEIVEPGYVYIWLSNENETPVEVYFVYPALCGDDFKVTQTKSPIIQMDDYYPFGMSARSYQRENSLMNRFLYNGGSEKQTDVDANIYSMAYRGMDVSIGRMMQIDPMADSYSSLSPYNFAFNDPVFWSDPSGADPLEDINKSRNYDIERNYYNSNGVIGDDDLYGTMFGRAGTVGYDYSMPTAASAWQDHLAGIFPGDVYSSDYTIIDYFTNGDRDRYIDTEVRIDVGGLAHSYSYSDPRFGSESKAGRDIPWYFEKNAFSDVLYEINRWNPIANAYNAVSTYLTGYDSYGVKQSNGEATIQLASAVPLPVTKIIGTGSKLLSQGAKALHQHHVLAQAFKPWFSSRGITNIDDYTIAVSGSTHLKGIHGKGLGNLPGEWNRLWMDFIEANPNATPSEIFHQAEGMLQRFGLEHLPYIKY